MAAASKRAVSSRSLAPAGLGQVVGRCVAAVDFWIAFTARLARRPAPWTALHHLLSAPLLLRVDRQWVELEHEGRRIRVRCRDRSSLLEELFRDAKPAAAGSEDADVDAVQIHPLTARWWRRRGWLTVPAFVRYTAPVESVPPRPLPRSLRANLARARRFGARRGHGSDWDLARTMVESWARARFGSRVWIPPKHAWGRLRRHGHLVVIHDGTRDVAAGIVIRAAGGSRAWFASLGLADGDAALLRAGALTAVYAAEVEEGRRLGAETFDAGRCPARTDDPIGAYKAHWGLRATADLLSPVYALRANTRAGGRFLGDLPVWALGPGGRLEPLVPEAGNGA